MIIADLSYLETVSEAFSIAGGTGSTSTTLTNTATNTVGSIKIVNSVIGNFAITQAAAAGSGATAIATTKQDLDIKIVKNLRRGRGYNQGKHKH